MKDPELSRIQHIFWFAPFNPACPSTRYRGLYPLRYMKSRYGITYTFVYPSYRPTKILVFLKAWFTAAFLAPKHSIIVIQKIHTSRIYGRALKMLVKLRQSRTIYDLDDAENLRRPVDSLSYFLRHCNTVFAGSQALKSYVRQFNKQVHVLTSPVTDHCIKTSPRKEKLVVGWIGDFGNGHTTPYEFSHRRSLYEIFFPSLKLLDFPVKLVLMGINQEKDIRLVLNYFSDHHNIEVDIPDNINWLDENDIYKRVSGFDIGVAPMTDHDFNRSKSAFKIKQYFSCGVPVLASNVGENRLFVEEDVNGFFCETSLQFADGIRYMHAVSNEQYLEFCKNALASRSKFSLENYCSAFFRCLLSEGSGYREMTARITKNIKVLSPD